MTSIPSLALALAALLLLGCGDRTQGPAPGGGTAAPPAAEVDDHAHSDHEVGPNGGSIAVSADHSLHFEIVHDRAAAQVRLFLFDEGMHAVAGDEAPVLNLRLDQGSVRVAGEAIVTAATPLGSAWRFAHPALAEEAEGRFRVAVRGETHTPDLAHVHEDGHDHADDGHEHPEGDHDHADDGHEHPEGGNGHAEDGHDHAEDGHEHPEGDHEHPEE